MKHYVCGDTTKQVIITSESWRSYVNDNKRFKPILRKTRKRKKVRRVTADKGFDSESNHRYAHKTGAKSIIPLRYRTSMRKTKGYYRRKLRRYFPKKKYNRRVIIETINSVEKRKFGDTLKSRRLKMQRREMTTTDIVYNIHRYMNKALSVLIGFLQSL